MKAFPLKATKYIFDKDICKVYVIRSIQNEVLEHKKWPSRDKRAIVAALDAIDGPTPGLA
jgi:hypothetical protein